MLLVMRFVEIITLEWTFNSFLKLKVTWKILWLNPDLLHIRSKFLFSSESENKRITAVFELYLLYSIDLKWNGSEDFLSADVQLTFSHQQEFWPLPSAVFTLFLKISIRRVYSSFC